MYFYWWLTMAEWIVIVFWFGLGLFGGIYWQALSYEDKISKLRDYAKKLKKENQRLKKNV